MNRPGVAAGLRPRALLSTDAVVIGTTILLLLSTIQGFGAERGTIANPAAIDPLAAAKLGIRLLALAASAFLWWTHPGAFRAHRFAPMVWLLAFFGLAGLTAFVSANPFVSASRAVSFAIVLVFATTAAASYAAEGRAAVYWRGFCLVVMATALPLFAIVLWRGRVVESYDTVARLGGLYQPNQLGALAGIVLLTAVMSLRRGRLVPLAIVVAPVAAGVALFTLSRGSWAAIAVGLAAAWWSVRRLRIWTVPAVALGATAMLLALATGALDLDRGPFAAARRGQTGAELLSGTGRTGLYTYLLERQFPQRPLLGFGFQMLSDEDVAGDPAPHQTGMARDLGWPAEQGHNLFLSVLIGTGLIGLSVFLVAVGTLLWRVIAAARTGDPMAGDHLVLLAVVLTHAMVDTTLVTGVDHAFLVLSAVAALVSVGRAAQRAPVPAYAVAGSRR